MTDPNWGIDPGTSPPTRQHAWFPSAEQPAPQQSPWQNSAAFGAPATPPQIPASTPASSSPSLQRRGGPGRVAGFTAVGVVVALVIGFGAGRLTSSTSPSAAVSKALAGADTHQVSSAPAPLTGKESDPAAAVAKSLAPAAVQLQGANDLGSGFIYDSRGLILTAAHVVQGNSTMKVRLNDGRQVDGTVVGSDAATDIAVIRIKVGDKLPTAALGVGVPVEVGQTAVALGSPYGLDQTVTAGIVSAVGRAVPIQKNSNVIGEVAMIQTDAPINPGNSGGMLANNRGQVIGLNDSIISGSQSGGGEPGNVGVGFAIPIDLAKSVADKLVAGQPIQFGYLGVKTQDADGSRVGGLVASVEPGSPAAKAGLKQGDVVVKVDQNPVASGTDLAAAIRARQPGETVKLTVYRDGSERAISVTLGETS